MTEHVTYQGLILDFGGVVTTDFYGALAAFSERAGLDPGAFTRVLREDPEGREAFHAVERGAIPQREFEVTMGRLLGLPDEGLLAAALADLGPRPGSSTWRRGRARTASSSRRSATRGAPGRTTRTTAGTWTPCSTPW